MASVTNTIRGLGLSPRLLSNRLGGQRSPTVSPLASPSIRRFSTKKKGNSIEDVIPPQSKSAGVSPAMVHLERPKNLGVSVAHVQESQNTFPLPTKSSEQFWSDLQDNLQETLWYRSEQASDSDLQFYRDFKKNYKPEFVAPNVTISQVDFSQLKQSNLPIPQWDRIKVDTKGMPSLEAALIDPQNYLNECGAKLGVRELNDWYNFNVLEFKKVDPNASQFLARYGNSLIRALVTNFPDHDWKMTRFDPLKGTIFDQPNTDFMNQVKRESSGEHSPDEEDWRTTMNRYKNHWQVTDFSTSKGNSMGHEASFFSRPNINDDWYKLSGTYAKQKELNTLVKKLFPNSIVMTNYTEPSLVYSDTQRPFALPSYIPALKIAFEIIEDPNSTAQYTFGAQMPVYTFYKSKRVICERNGISLVQIPSWWDPISSPASHLINAIRRIRPDVADKINLQPAKTTSVPISVRVAPKETEVKAEEEEKVTEEPHSERV